MSASENIEIGSHTYYHHDVSGGRKGADKKAGESQEEYEKILNEFDINNMEYISAILSEISFLSKYDVSYTNEKLKSIVENMEKCDSSFVLAYMSLSLIGIKDLQTSIKKNFLQDVVNLIKEYSIMADTGENIERY